MSDAPAPKPSLLAMPPTLGRYEVRAKIGEGGMAAVYVGYEPRAGQPGRAVALKVVKDEYAQNRQFVDMFIDEGRIAAKLSHPNVVRILELGSEDGRLFIVMELLKGQSLLDVWDAARERGRRIPYDLAAWVGARIAEGLHHAHDYRNEAGEPLGIVHRDVTPNNVFVTYDGDIKIIDFGLAKGRGRVTKTAAGVVKGKLAYLSPEAATGTELDRRADIFALGTTLWEVTTDRRLFKHDSDGATIQATREAVVPDPGTIVPGYPVGLWHVLKKALARERDARHATAQELARELDAFASGQGRPVDAGVLTAFMTKLFPRDRERQDEWLQTASGPLSHVPLVQLKVPSQRSAHLPVPVSALPPVLMPAAAPVRAPTSPGRSRMEATLPSGAIPEATAAVPVVAQPSPSRGRLAAFVLLGFAVALAIAFIVTRF